MPLSAPVQTKPAPDNASISDQNNHRNKTAMTTLFTDYVLSILGGCFAGDAQCDDFEFAASEEKTTTTTAVAEENDATFADDEGADDDSRVSGSSSGGSSAWSDLSESRTEVTETEWQTTKKRFGGVEAVAPFLEGGKWKLLGAGTFGRVFSAAGPGKEDVGVAIKVVDGTELYSRETFRNERLALQVFKNAGGHQNIVTMFDHCRGPENLAVLILEDGGCTLEHLLDHALVPSQLHEVLIAMQVSAGLAFAHSHGIANQDLKAGNILAGTPSAIHARICDFGCAHVDAGKFKCKKVAGTQVYWSPEKRACDSRDPSTHFDARADDVWALATVFASIANKCADIVLAKERGVDGNVRRTPILFPGARRHPLAGLIAEIFAAKNADERPKMPEVSQRLGSAEDLKAFFHI